MTPALDPVRLDALRKLAEAATPGEWHWAVEDYSMATLGVGEMPGNGTPHVLTVSPCKYCQASAPTPKVWEWGRCHTPTAANAAYIAAMSPDTTLAMLAERAGFLARIAELEAGPKVQPLNHEGSLADLDDLDTEYARSNTISRLHGTIQALHAGISRRDWQATETAANALRDALHSGAVK